jgi:hypothetical protein
MIPSRHRYRHRPEIHPLAHCLAMFVCQAAVNPADQDAAVPVAGPGRNPRIPGRSL